MENYNTTIELRVTAENTYEALVHQILLWWSELFIGESEKTGDVFTVRFGDHIHKTIRIKEAIPHLRVIWSVEDSLIAIPELKNQTEWIGTNVVWEIEQKENSSLLQLTHVGLNPTVECYTICSGGWKQFIGSLKLFLETGTGTPYKN
ncbi:SRPBCC family protein [Chryseobacterium sp. MEBOG07]|uniref:SRPBCC family protein n=1 Tax=Chryseobacterium sp. MEBOG07 TaxID=2879939 RepID=UPI001F3D6332|nr:SRPBCC domain-containing protein [Chryseobacterium sp. MEBOG07]UKB78189.1 SRPBCC domain-containing protein [Chryseobacterium sp. MEBOG07]